MSIKSTMLLILALSMAACSWMRGTDDPYSEGGSDSVYIDAVNDHYYDARIHAVYTGGQRRSLGTVAGNGGEVERAIRWEPHALVFEIEFVVSGAMYATHPLDVSRGEQIELRLPPNIEQSGFFRRVSGR